MGADILHNMGCVLGSQGKYEDAMKMFQEALSIQKEVFGNRHANVADILHNMGCVLGNQGKYEAAMERYQNALSIRREVFGNPHEDVAQTLHNMGCILDKQEPSLDNENSGSSGIEEELGQIQEDGN